MISLKKKNIIYLFLFLMLALMSVTYSNSSEIKQNDVVNDKSKETEFKEALQKLQLNIAVVVSDKEMLSRLAFFVKNNSKVDITIPEFTEGQNRIEIILPSGKSAGNYTLWMEKAAEITIKPSETKIWFMDAPRLLKIQTEEGLYRIKWKIYNIESKEFLLLKEKDKKESIETNIQ